MSNFCGHRCRGYIVYIFIFVLLVDAGVALYVYINQPPNATEAPWAMYICLAVAVILAVLGCLIGCSYQLCPGREEDDETVYEEIHKTTTIYNNGTRSKSRWSEFYTGLQRRKWVVWTMVYIAIGTSVFVVVVVSMSSTPPSCPDSQGFPLRPKMDQCEAETTNAGCLNISLCEWYPNSGMCALSCVALGWTSCSCSPDFQGCFYCPSILTCSEKTTTCIACSNQTNYISCGSLTGCQWCEDTSTCVNNNNGLPITC